MKVSRCHIQLFGNHSPRSWLAICKYSYDGASREASLSGVAWRRTSLSTNKVSPQWPPQNGVTYSEGRAAAPKPCPLAPTTTWQYPDLWVPWNRSYRKPPLP